MRDNRDILDKLRWLSNDMEYMEVPGEWLPPVTEAADKIEKLRAALVKAREQMQWLAENERECLGVVPMDDGSEVPAIWIAVASIDAALEAK